MEYGLLTMAHTDGDMFVHFKNSNVLVVGDAVQPGRLPMLDFPRAAGSAACRTRSNAAGRLANDTTKIVPATGPVMTKAELQANLDYLTKVREKLVTLMKTGQGRAGHDRRQGRGGISRAAEPGMPDTFLFTAYRGLWAHARELGGIV